jgi:hypothetical protein
MTRMFSCWANTCLWMIAVVGLVILMTALALSHGEARVGSECSGDVAHGVACDVPASGLPTHRDDGAGVAGANAAGAAGEPYSRCEPAPGFFPFLGDAGDKKNLGQGTKANRASLVARIHLAGRRLGVAPHLGEGIAWTESRFDPAARSADGSSVGAFQLTRVTAAAMRRRLAGVTGDLPLHDEVTLAIGYLRYLSGLFARPTILDDLGNTTTAVADCAERWRFAIAAYNAGEGRVAAAQRRAAAAGLDPARFDNVRPYLPRITRRYVDSVLTFAASQIAARASRAG